MPSAIVKSSYIEKFKEPIEEFFDNIEWMRKHYKADDIDLYYAIDKLDFDKVRKLLDNGADATAIEIDGFDAEDNAVCIAERGLLDILHIIDNDIPEEYPSPQNVYEEYWWDLVRSSSYEHMVTIINKYSK